ERGGAHRGRADRARVAHAAAQPQVVRGRAQERLRGRARDLGAGHAHARLVGHHRRGAGVGVPRGVRDVRARPRDARPAGRAQRERRGAALRAAAGGERPRVLAAERGDARRAARRERGAGGPSRGSVCRDGELGHIWCGAVLM
ncbi:MAG: Protoporphyrin IX Mg-chelatase subunit H, partial [uncultured Solirubrobacterales bacterium]